MKYNSPPQSIEQLATFLLSKGMVIEDIKTAKENLTNIGYFRFKKFSTKFQIKGDTDDYSFSNNTYFEEIIDNYSFDSQLRIIIFEAIANIEIAYKSVLNYTMTLRSGCHWYLDPTVFKPEFSQNSDENSQSGYDKFLFKLTKECAESSDRFVQKYKFNYSEPELPPSWIVLDIISFGMSSHIYQNILSTDARNEISAMFKINQKFFETWLISLSYIRNQCAHHQKIIEKKVMYPPRMPQRSTNKFIEEEGNDGSLYNVLCVIRNCLRNIKSNSFFKDSLIDLINCNEQIDLKLLGFPDNWRNEEIWQ